MRCIFFSPYYFQGHFLYIEKRAMMDDIKDIKKAIQVGLVVAVFLGKTERYLQAIELCKECLILLDNSAMGVEEQLSKLCYRGIIVVMFNVYFSISDYTNTERQARKLLPIFRDSGDKGLEGTLSLLLATIYYGQSRFVEAKELCERAIKNMKATGNREKEGTAHGNLGAVLTSLGEYQKAKEHHEKALAIKMEIGDTQGEEEAYGSLGVVFYSIGEYKKAKKYHEKALAISMEIVDRKREGAAYGNLGLVFHSLGEYKKAKEYHEKALANTMEIGDRQGEGAIYSYTSEACFIRLVNIKRLKNITRKHLPSQWKLATEKGKE